MESEPTTDEQVAKLLKYLPVTLAFYRIQRDKGYSVAEAWAITRKILP